MQVPDADRIPKPWQPRPDPEEAEFPAKRSQGAWEKTPLRQSRVHGAGELVIDRPSGHEAQLDRQLPLLHAAEPQTSSESGSA